MYRRFPLSFILLLVAVVLLTACDAAPAEEPDLVATQVAVERAAAATLTTEAQTQQPTSTPTVAPAATATPTSASPTTEAPAATSTPTPVPPTVAPTPTPTPTQIVAVVFPVDGSDGDRALRGSFVQSNGGRNVLLSGIAQNAVTNPMIFRDRLPVRVEVFDDTVGTIDGDGIAAVDFDIRDPSGETVLRTIEQTDPYCLWGGNDPACPAPTFAELGYRWPGNNLPIENGSYQASILITGTRDTSITWFWSFEIDHGAALGEEAAAPVELVLRPACGNNPTVPAGAPIDLLYGIWATRGYDRAAANQSYIRIELTIDGQPVSGERQLPPVADLPQAICGVDYADSYWVYHTVRLDPLGPGQHNVRIVYSFTQTVQDGYGGTYNQPFTQQYVITVQ
ncbi:MAG: hypothetical protein KF893_19695 [Caldilineaceae bacterium]|nr:hypothetical protein [Caldilineaceae bacterium]